MPDCCLQDVSLRRQAQRWARSEDLTRPSAPPTAIAAGGRPPAQGNARSCPANNNYASAA
eukprot:11508018-Alexandrium_andersonii.AAC.1